MSDHLTAQLENGRTLHLVRDAVLAAGALSSAGLFYAEEYPASLVAAVASWLFGAALHHAGLMFAPDAGDAWVLLRWRRFRWLLALACVPLALNIMFAYSAYTLPAQLSLILAALLAFELIPILLIVGGVMWAWGMTAAVATGGVLAVLVVATWIYRQAHRHA
jgi:hypothetical protein